MSISSPVLPPGPFFLYSALGISGMRKILKSGGLRRAVLVLFLAAAAVASYHLRIRHDLTDFGVCYQAGGRYLAGESLYRSSDGHLQFKYAPLAAAFYAPFAALPWNLAKISWFLLMLGCLGGILLLTARALPGQGPVASWSVGWSLLIWLKYIGREIELGQVNLVILLLLLALIRELSAGRDRTAGILWAVSLFIKPYAVVFLPYFILKRKWTTVATGAGTILLGLFLPVLNFGWTGNWALLKEWTQSLSHSTQGLLAVGDNASLYAFFAKTLGLSTPTGALAMGGIGAAVIAGLILGMIKTGERERIEKAEISEGVVLMMLIPMLSPLGWNYNYLYALPASALLVHALARFSLSLRAVVVVNFILIGGTLREILGRTAFRYYTGRSFIVPSVLVVLAVLFLARRRRLI
jgi:hypothetical protein